MRSEKPENWSYAQRIGPLSPNVKLYHNQEPAALLWILLQGNPFKMRGGLQTAPAVMS
jgi:hypothetical protein